MEEEEEKEEEKKKDPETYYLDESKWIRLLYFIEADGHISDGDWDKHINYSYSRLKLSKERKKFRKKNNRRPNEAEEIPSIISKMKSILIPCSLWEERYFHPKTWDTEIFFKNIRAITIMGYTLIGTNDPINNPYTVFNLLSININYDKWTPEFKKIVGSGFSGRILNWNVYPKLNTLFEQAGFDNVGREFKSILTCLTHIFKTKDKYMTKDGDETIRNSNIDNLAYQLKTHEVFTKEYAYPFGRYSVTQIANFTNNTDMLEFIKAATWRDASNPGYDFYLHEENQKIKELEEQEKMRNLHPHKSDSLSDASPRVATPVASPRVASPIVLPIVLPIALPRHPSQDSAQSSAQSSAQILRNPSKSSLRLSSNKQSSFRQSSRRASTMRISRTNPKTKKGYLWGDIKKCDKEYKKIEQLEDKIDSLTSTKEEQIFIKNKTAKKLTKEFDKLTRFNRKLINRLNELSPDLNYNSRVSELSNSNDSLHNSLETMRISRSQPIVKKGYLWDNVKKCIQETETIEKLKDSIDGLYKEIKEEKKIKQETVKLLTNNNKKLTKENNNLKSKIKNITQYKKLFGIGRGVNNKTRNNKK